MFEGVEVVPDQKVRVAFFRVNDIRLELLEPTDPTSTIATFLEKRGEGLHHIAYTVEGPEDRIAELKVIRIADDQMTFPAPAATSDADCVRPSQEYIGGADGIGGEPAHPGVKVESSLGAETLRVGSNSIGLPHPITLRQRRELSHLIALAGFVAPEFGGHELRDSGSQGTTARSH